MNAHIFFLQSRVCTFMNDFCSTLYTLHFTPYTLTIQPNMRSSAWCSPLAISMRALATAMWLDLPFRVARGRCEPPPAPSLRAPHDAGVIGDPAKGRESDIKDRVPWLLWMFWQVMVLPDRRMVYSPVRTVSNTGFVVSSSKSSI